MNMKSFLYALGIVSVLALIISLLSLFRTASSMMPREETKQYVVSIENQSHDERWVLRPYGAVFYFNTTPMGKVIVAQDLRGYSADFHINGTTYTLQFPKSPNSLLIDEKTEGVLSITGELQQITIPQPATLSKERRVTDGSIIIRLKSFGESLYYNCSITWLYPATPFVFLRPQEFLLSKRTKWEAQTPFTVHAQQKEVRVSTLLQISNQ